MLTSLLEHNTRKVPRKETSTGNGLACPTCQGELIDDPDQKYTTATVPPRRTVLCRKCPKPSEPLQRLVVVAADLAAEEQKLLAALETAKKTAREEMIDSKAQWVTERDPSGWLGYSKEVYDKFFESFPEVSAMMDRFREEVKSRGFVMGPTFRRRVLFRVLTERASFIADAERRAVNSPIQCISSENGVTAGYLIAKAMHKYCLDFNLDVDKFMSKYCRAVHDANYFEEAYIMVIPALHIHLHCSSAGATEFYQKEFGFFPNLNSELEIDFGANDADSQSWNYVVADLIPILKKAIADRVKFGYLEKEHEQAAFRTVMTPWIRKKNRHYLQQHYPLLQVSDLEEIICAAVEKAGFTPER